MAKVIKAFKLKPDCYCTSKYLNNLIEQGHRHIKVRKTRYQSINTAKNTLKGIECIYALYKRTAGLFRSTDFRHATKLGICSPVKEQRHDKMVISYIFLTLQQNPLI